MLARHGWTAELGEPGSEPSWRCPACDERNSDVDSSNIARGDATPSPRRLRVLLIDDQVLVLRATAGMLREFDVYPAGSAAEALAKLNDGSHFDVVVSDVSMPGITGPELFVAIRTQHPHLAEQFLLLTGDGYGASLMCAVIARREGITQLPKILEKPVPRDVLVREIEQLGRRRLPRSGTFSIDAATQVPRVRRTNTG